jgi:hypothetical protein
MAGAPLGNTNGCKENRLVTDILRRLVVQDKAERIAKGCEALLDRFAEYGDLQAGHFIFDRLDGKSKQMIEATGLDGKDLIPTGIVITLVKP